MNIFKRKDKDKDVPEEDKQEAQAEEVQPDESQGLTEENLEELNGDTEEEEQPEPTEESEEPTEEEPEPTEEEEPEPTEEEDGPSREELYEINEKLTEELFLAKVKLDGRLADPTDLPFSPDFLTDPEALDKAITALIKSKPGLKARKLGGDIGAGARGKSVKEPTDLMQLVRAVHGY